jgi:hypothetical protein
VIVLLFLFFWIFVVCVIVFLVGLAISRSAGARHDELMRAVDPQYEARQKRGREVDHWFLGCLGLAVAAIIALLAVVAYVSTHH